MKFTLASTLAVALFFAQAQACAKDGQVCQVRGNRACGCNSGNLFQCEKKAHGGLAWVNLGTCPANPGGLQCVDGKCVI